VLRPQRIAAATAAGLLTVLGSTGCGVVDKFTGGGEEKEDGNVKLVASENAAGTVVTDGQGRTLYRWDKDIAKPPKSNCVGECPSSWIPVTVKGQATVQGIDPNLIGMIKRSDEAGPVVEESMQLTLNGWPLYRFIKDKEPGDMKGQGVAGTWWLVAPDGTRVKSAPPAPGGNQDGGNEEQAPPPAGY
jgi:predicted lipoprotein with Yx(FWY)xxD motif